MATTSISSSRAPFEVKRFGFFEGEDGVQRYRITRLIDALRVNHSAQCGGVTDRREDERTGDGLEHHETPARKTFGDSLVHSSRDDITNFNRSTVMAQHPAFLDDPMVRHVHLVRTPPPGPRECHDDERTDQSERQYRLVLVNNGESVSSDNHQRGGRDDEQKRSDQTP